MYKAAALFSRSRAQLARTLCHSTTFCPGLILQSLLTCRSRRRLSLYSGLGSTEMTGINNTSEKTKVIWLDCDPGHDDALAIVLAGYNESIHLLGISTVAANQSVHKVTRNALQILEASGLHSVEVVQGQAKPILRPELPCPEIHGDSGLALHRGSLPVTKLQPVEGKGILVMYDRISQFYKSRRRKVSLVCTGALTNIALLLTLFPEISEYLEQIILMGGAIGSGNTNPVAEFNLQVDPEAGKIVFESGLKIVMIPLEVTHTALATEEIMQRILVKKSLWLELVKEILTYFSDTYKRMFGFQDPPLHDPCAVAYVINPSLFKCELMRVDVEVVSPLSAGQTICDIYHWSKLPKNVHVAKEMDVEAFWALQIDAIHQADKHSPLNK